MTFPRRLGAHTPTVLAMLCATLGAEAQTTDEPRVISAGVLVGLTQDDNVFLSPQGSETADTVTTLGARVLVNQPVGRQRLRLDVALDSNRYSDLESQDNNTYNVQATWDWATIERLSGQVGAQATESYNRFRRSDGPDINKERVRRAFARAQIGGVTVWTFDGGMEAYERSYTEDGSGLRNQERWTADIGARYQNTPAWTARAAIRHTRGEYPDFTPAQADEFDRTDFEVGVTWVPSPITSVQARLAWSDETHTAQPGGDLGFLSGEILASWQPTGKLTFTATASRDSDTTAEDGDPDTTFSEATTRTRLGVGAAWQLTSKIQITAVADQIVSDQEGLGFSGSATQRSMGLAVRYSPARAVDLACRVRWARQTTSGPVLGIGEYRSTVYGCTAELWFR